MLFASFDFLLFFAPVFLGFWALRDRPMARTALLIAASYFFYMASSRPPDGSLPTPWYFAGLLFFSTVLDYVASGRIHALNGDLASADAARAERADITSERSELTLPVTGGALAFRPAYETGGLVLCNLISAMCVAAAVFESLSAKDVETA